MLGSDILILTKHPIRVAISRSIAGASWISGNTISITLDKGHNDESFVGVTASDLKAEVVIY